MIKKDKSYKVKIIDNERIIVSTHTTNPFEASKIKFKGNRKSLNYENMTIANYHKALKRYTEKLYCCSIDCNKCKFITLTLNNEMSWNEFIDKIGTFMETLKRYFGRDIDYIKAIEFQRCLKLHAHLIIIFPNEMPKNLTKWVNNHWEYGSFRVEKVYSIYNLIDYLTKKKGKKYIKDIKKGITLFPANAKIITTTLKPSKNIRTIEISQEELEFARQYHWTPDNKNIREDKHWYNVNGETYSCTDKIYIKSSKEFVENNYGTAKDDEILKNEQK